MNRARALLSGGVLRLLLVLGIATPHCLLALYAVASYQAGLIDATEGARTRTAVLAEYAARVFDGHALLVDLVIDELEKPSPVPPSSATLTAIQSRHQPLRNLKVAIVLLDHSGVVLANTLDPRLQGRNFGDRSYFVHAQASDRTVITEQISGRVTGESFFSLSRRFERGVVVVAIYTATFEEMFSRLASDGEHQNVVALFNIEGKQLARTPSIAKPVNLTSQDPGLMQHIPDSLEGIYRIVPRTSQDEHFYAYRRVSGYPAWVVYGFRVNDIIIGWGKTMVLPTVIAVLAASLLATLTLRAMHQQRRAVAQENYLNGLVEERTREAELRAADAVRAHREKSLFLASASHDLRQPIQGLRLSLDILDQRLTVPDDRQIIDLANRSLQGAEELLAALLDVSVLDAGNVRPNPRPVELAPLLGDLVAEFGPKSTNHVIRLKTARCSTRVMTDPVLLTRMVRNLLSNAVRHTSNGQVILSCLPVAGRVRLQVWDNGPGIPGDKLDTIFDDFVQLANPERDRTKGLGLGLAVVRRMAGLLDHPVGVRSRPGRGSVFWVEVPVAMP